MCLEGRALLSRNVLLILGKVSLSTTLCVDLPLWWNMSRMTTLPIWRGIKRLWQPPILHAWGNYFGIANFSRTFSMLGHWIWHRSWQYLNRKFSKTPRPVLGFSILWEVSSPRNVLCDLHATWMKPSVDAKWWRCTLQCFQ